MKTFTAKDAEKITAFPIRRIRFYTSSKVLLPDAKLSSGRGVANEFSIKNLVELEIIKILCEAGIDLTNIKKIIKAVSVDLKTYLQSVSDLIEGNPRDQDLDKLTHFVAISRSGPKKIACTSHVSYEEPWLQTTLEKQGYNCAIVINIMGIIRKLITRLTK